MNDTIDRIESSDTNKYKDVWRKENVNLAIKFLKETEQPLRLLTLPGKRWRFERLLVAACIAEGIKIEYIRGFENHRATYLTALANIKRFFPKNIAGKIALSQNSIDDKISCCQWPNRASPTVILADYCGNPHQKGNWGSCNYKWTRLNVGADCIVRAANGIVANDGSDLDKGQVLYISNFLATGQHVGKISHKNIRFAFYQYFATKGFKGKSSCLVNKDEPRSICKVEDILYHGGGNAIMFTSAYATNLFPDSPLLKYEKQNWLKNPPRLSNVVQEVKPVKVAKVAEVKSNIGSLLRMAICFLSDKGATTQDIAACFPALGKHTIGSTLAWYKHRASFKNVGRKNNCCC